MTSEIYEHRISAQIGSFRNVSRNQADIDLSLDMYGMTQGTGLVASYTFDEGAGHIIHDVTG